MTTFTTKTGLGYIREDATGNIVAKCEFPAEKKLPDTEDEEGKTIPGEIVPVIHPIKDGYTFIEVADKAELDAINVYTPPVVKTPEQIVEEKIQAEMRRLAVENLKARGEI